MKHIPIIALLTIGLVGFSLMLAAFTLVRRRGGWQSAMKSDAGGHWLLPRKIMFAGASLGVLFVLLIFVPGMIPWWDYGWGVYGPILGIILTSGILQIVQMARKHTSPSSQEPQPGNRFQHQAMPDDTTTPTARALQRKFRRVGLIHRITASVFALTSIYWAVNYFRHSEPEYDVAMSLFYFCLSIVFFLISTGFYRKANAKQQTSTTTTETEDK